MRLSSSVFILSMELKGMKDIMCFIGGLNNIISKTVTSLSVSYLAEHWELLVEYELIDSPLPFAL